MSPGQSPSGVAAQAQTVFALAMIGNARIGVPSSSVVQVVPRPAQLMNLPRHSQSIDGLFLHVGRLLPVVRLDRWIDMGERGRPVDERILVLRDSGRLIGLLVDSVMGVRRLCAGDQMRIHHDDDGHELFQSAAAGGPGEPILSLLEVDRLMTLVDVWCEDGGAATGSDLSAAQDTDAEPTGRGYERKETYASFRIGDAYAAFPAADIGELIPRAPLQHGLPLSSEARGIISWRGRFVPVVDLTRRIGGRVDDAVAPWICIVRRGESTIGVLVHEVTALLSVESSTLSKPAHMQPTLANPEPALIRCSIVSETIRTVQLIDTDALMSLYPEVAISARPGAAAEKDERAYGHCTESAFMIFDAGTPFASPIHSVQEVIALPPALATRMDAGFAATVEWRGHAVPLVDLRQSNDAADATDLRQLVIIADGDQHAAVAIGGVRALVPSRGATRRRFPTGGRGMIDMVMIDMPNHQGSYAVLDLKQFV